MEREGAAEKKQRGKQKDMIRQLRGETGNKPFWKSETQIRGICVIAEKDIEK
jgi:hypothetical protein